MRGRHRGNPGWVTHLEVSWEQLPFARFMRRLAERMRVLHFDKRGTGMSDRFARPPDLETRMDDVRAVMDTAGVERAALFAWGDGGPPLAAFFAATHPERTLALCIDPHIHLRRTHDYPFGETEEEFEEWLSDTMAVWGDEVALFDDEPTDAESLRSSAKLSRFAATPGSMAALSRMWFETDVLRDILPTIRIPDACAVDDGQFLGRPRARGVRRRADTRRSNPWASPGWTRWTPMRTSTSPRSNRSSRRCNKRKPSSIESSPQSCSPTSWTQQSGRLHSATRHGRSSSSAIMRSFALCWLDTEGPKWTRQEMASSLRSTGLLGPCIARSRS